MLMHVTRLRESFAANITRVRPFAGVSSGVFRQRRAVPERQITPDGGTLVRPLPGVSAHVRLQRAGVRELLATVGTGEGTLACVNAGMGLQQARLRKCLCANGALEGTVAGVLAHVNFQRRRPRQLLTADVALALLYSGRPLPAFRHRQLFHHRGQRHFFTFTTNDVYFGLAAAKGSLLWLAR